MSLIERLFMSEVTPSPSSPTKMPIDQLVAHPSQCHYFSRCSSEEDAALKADIEKYGQREAVQVAPPGNAAGLPAYTILDGHRRVQALRDLGKTEVSVIVRDDLVGHDEDAMETIFISFNLNRRQMSKLAQAFAAKKLLEIEHTKSGTYGSRAKQQIRERIGKLLGMSGRHLARMMHILRTPVQVQRAWDAGHVRLITAEKVADLSREKKRELAAALRDAGLEKAQEVIERFVGKPETTHKNPTAAFHAYCKSMDHHLLDLNGRIGDVNEYEIGRHRATLVAASKAINKMLARAKRPTTPKQQEANMAAMLKRFSMAGRQ
jgi:hypothetical protein